MENKCDEYVKQPVESQHNGEKGGQTYLYPERYVALLRADERLIGLLLMDPIACFSTAINPYF
jgi:hypothetical protein